MSLPFDFSAIYILNTLDKRSRGGDSGQVSLVTVGSPRKGVRNNLDIPHSDIPHSDAVLLELEHFFTNIAEGMVGKASLYDVVLRSTRTRVLCSRHEVVKSTMSDVTAGRRPNGTIK